MPFRDGTGPRGNGPMTGRGAGFCAGYATPGYMMNSGFGQGFGRGGGRGRRNWFYATGMPGWMRAAQGMPAFGGIMNPSATKDEKAMLKEQAEFMKKQIDEIQKRIDQLGSTE
jgi:hypothetical protein